MRSANICSVLGAAVLSAGCINTTPPPPRADIPPVGTYTQVRGHPEKLPPGNEPNGYEPPFVDEPLITQAPPEQGDFVKTYQDVGSPRIALFVNRTEQAAGAPEADQVGARRIDFDAVEKIMAGWMRSGGRVTIVSQQLTDAEHRNLQQGQAGILQQLSKNGTHVLIQVQARPTQQLPSGTRMVAEAVETATGESLGSAVVDVPPPLDTPIINESTRFLARKLMLDMTRTWRSPRPAPQGGQSQVPQGQPGASNGQPPATERDAAPPLMPPPTALPPGPVPATTQP